MQRRSGIARTPGMLLYLRGDTNLERCLFAPDFKEILHTGEVKDLAAELGFAAKNEGKNLRIPSAPKETILMHGNVAVAYGLSTSNGPDGRRRITRYADYYVWEDNSWRAFFEQQAQVEQK
jgi:hypothetical protein